jgi:hypothetical protein
MPKLYNHTAWHDIDQATADWLMAHGLVIKHQGLDWYEILASGLLTAQLVAIAKQQLGEKP